MTAKLPFACNHSASAEAPGCSGVGQSQRGSVSALARWSLLVCCVALMACGNKGDLFLESSDELAEQLNEVDRQIGPLPQTEDTTVDEALDELEEEEKRESERKRAGEQ